MSKTVGVKPRWFSALAFWGGSDHYGILQALRREPLLLPLDTVSRVYEIKAKPLIGLGGSARFALEYQSERRQCFIALEELPAELLSRERTVINPPKAAALFFRHSCQEPTALLLPFLIPFFIMLMVWFLSLWNDYVVHQRDVMSFFSRPGCDAACVGKVLQIHSMVVFLFFVQLSLLFLPMMILFLAPRYRCALNYRLAQTYSLASALIGFVIFVQLVANFPFRQYGKFVEMGFGPQAERVIARLPTK